jgi:hypothetical protein
VIRTQQLLAQAWLQAQATMHPLIEHELAATHLDLICRNVQNRAVARLILACALAKVDQPQIDIRKPYTEIEGNDTFSGRTYDERFISTLILAERLPCNATTAFLTPALRNINRPLTAELDLVGRPREVYQAALYLLAEVAEGRLHAETLLIETLRRLLVVRDENEARMKSLLARLQSNTPTTLAVDEIIGLLQQHFAVRGASRLPVLAIVALYQILQALLPERVATIHPHQAADQQTETLGDIEIYLRETEQITAVYEVKFKVVMMVDVQQALHKLAHHPMPIQRYLFVTTKPIEIEIERYCASMYRKVGVEFAVFDCLSFVRTILYLFHPLRVAFLERYQALVLSEPDSGVTQPVKEAFLALRQAAESESETN